MKDETRWSLGVYWIPFILGSLSACLFIYTLSKLPRNASGFWLMLISLGVAAGVAAVLTALSAATANLRAAESKRDEKMMEEKLGEEKKRNEGLLSRLEVLNAMSEVTGVISDAVDLKQIVPKVFKILEPLVKCEQMALVMTEEDGSLSLKAAHRGGETLFDEALEKIEVRTTDISEAIDRQAVVKTVEDATGIFSIPLVADQNTVGVMQFVVPLGPVQAQKERQLRELEKMLTDITKHLALVVKTPRLHGRAIIDSLTGLFTRRHFDIRLDDMFRLARRYQSPFSMILIDIDNFKLINDTYGHTVGDMVLRETASLFVQNIRDCDSAFRYGGEEFALLLPQTSARQAAVIAERLCKLVRENRITSDTREIGITISAGIAEYTPELANQGQVIALADHALYSAKKAGRDRYVIEGESDVKQEE